MLGEKGEAATGLSGDKGGTSPAAYIETANDATHNKANRKCKRQVVFIFIFPLFGCHHGRDPDEAVMAASRKRLGLHPSILF